MLHAHRTSWEARSSTLGEARGNIGPAKTRAAPAPPHRPPTVHQTRLRLPPYPHDCAAWAAGGLGGGLASRGPRYHTVSMPNVLVRDLPEEVHARLQRRAESQGQSLQQYLVAELRRLAERPTIEEVLDRIERRSGGRVGFDQAVADLSEDRDAQ